MKTILACTDFSSSANNAIEYAVEMAKITKGKLIIFHAYHEMEGNSIKELTSIEKKIHLKHGNKLITECQARCGSPVNEINVFADENKIDLIVMGMEGTGYLQEKLIGSATTSLIKHSRHPVMAIDKHVKFKNINKIVLACDNTEIKDKSILNPLKELALLFKSYVYVLNVVPESEVLQSVDKEFSSFIKVNDLMHGIDHSFHFTSNDDVVKGINDFVKVKEIDMVVIIPRIHTILEKIFYPPISKQMAFHMKAALLALHE